MEPTRPAGAAATFHGPDGPDGGGFWDHRDVSFVGRPVLEHAVFSTPEKSSPEKLSRGKLTTENIAIKMPRLVEPPRDDSALIKDQKHSGGFPRSI